MFLSQLLKSDASLGTAKDVPVSGITSDSRQVKPGFVFVALAGTKVDGRAFIAQAIVSGASAIVAEQGSTAEGASLVTTDNPRRLLALMASRFYDRQPDTIVAVTGTNGKTSVSVFVRQIWAAMGFRAASLGTIGVIGPDGAEYLTHTTPDPVQLAQLVAKLRDDHVQHLAIEASSHGLIQNRLDGLRLTAGAFTNLTRDHLDYHHTLEAYFDAKMRLFEALLPKGAPAVINMDSGEGEAALKRVRAAGLLPFTVGEKGIDLKLISSCSNGMGEELVVETRVGRFNVSLPLVGGFQVSNALVAAGLVIASGGETHLVLHALESLKGASGRLELVGTSKTGASIFVDYAHTPDALENALQALRPYVKEQLVLVFGCGGDRDKGKRPLMGAIASKLADRVVVTDDNPRSENPAQIRSEIMVAAAGAVEIGDRAKAIASAVSSLNAGDVLLVAGKGHEEGQKVGSISLPFKDHDAVKAAIVGADYHG
ncbi:MAG: UDP-N-acetylmuramoyl-L-alanyl-D-glutamate--2,6-diaminopimelate ligase [Alphaproteobacteria bacterium]|nr:UDP-N-acetylmuramoyl-L-alanyl-D-glutamate--2,6-diaminopimelate ligase [Alphaproteobacteria bacterium]